MSTSFYTHGIKAEAYTLRETRGCKLGDLDWFPGLERPRMGRSANYTDNRYASRWGDAPQIGGVQHIAVTREFLVRNSPDQSAENVVAWGTHPGNNGASWNDTVDTDSFVPFLPTWKRPWQHGVSDSPAGDPNSLLVGQELGIMSTDWRTKPDWFVESMLRMSAAVWAMYVAELDWPLEVVLNRAEVLRRLATRQKLGFTEHWILDPKNRLDAGRVGQVTTFPWHKRHAGGPGLLPMIREELGIRAGGHTATPGLPKPSPTVMALQRRLNADFGAHLDVDGSFGPLTNTAARRAATDTEYTGSVSATGAAALTTHLEAFVKKLDQLIASNARIEKKLDEIPDEVWAARIPFKEGTSLHAIFGPDFRAGALQGYSAGHAFRGAGRDVEEIKAEVREVGNAVIVAATRANEGAEDAR